MHTKAQSIVEFTFAMVAVLLLILCMVQVFRWAGMDTAQRRWLQDNSIVNLGPSGDPATELNSDMDVSQPMSAVYHGAVTDGNYSP